MNLTRRSRAALRLRQLTGRVPSSWAVALVDFDELNQPVVSLPILAPGFGELEHLTLAADPFFTTWQDTVFVFFEAVARDKPLGQIHWATLDLDGSCSYHGPALTTDVHTSFPYVFFDETEGRYFMIPETSAAAEVRLYSAPDPSGPWSMDAVLAEGSPFADSVAIRASDGWLLVSESSGGQHDRRQILAADRLSGPFEQVGFWQLSRRSTRMAGRYVDPDRIDGDDVLLLNQKCDRVYGESVGVERMSMSSKPATDLTAQDFDFGVTTPLLEANLDDWYHTKVHSADLRRDSVGAFGIMDGRGHLRKGTRPKRAEIAEFVTRALAFEGGDIP